MFVGLLAVLCLILGSLPLSNCIIAANNFECPSVCRNSAAGEPLDAYCANFILVDVRLLASVDTFDFF